MSLIAKVVSYRLMTEHAEEPGASEAMLAWSDLAGDASWVYTECLMVEARPPKQIDLGPLFKPRGATKDR